MRVDIPNVHAVATRKRFVQPDPAWGTQTELAALQHTSGSSACRAASERLEGATASPPAPRKSAVVAQEPPAAGYQALSTSHLVPARRIVVLVHVRSAVTVVVDRPAVLEVLHGRPRGVSAGKRQRHADTLQSMGP